MKTGAELQAKLDEQEAFITDCDEAIENIAKYRESEIKQLENWSDYTYGLDFIEKGQNRWIRNSWILIIAGVAIGYVIDSQVPIYIFSPIGVIGIWLSFEQLKQSKRAIKKTRKQRKRLLKNCEKEKESWKAARYEHFQKMEKIKAKILKRTIPCESSE